MASFSAIPMISPKFLQLHIPTHFAPLSVSQKSSLSFRFSPSNLNRTKSLSIRSVSVPAAPTSGAVAPAISLTDDALKHLNKMRSERSEDLCLRIGVKQGGCSGMSYTMDFEDRAKTRPNDSVIEYKGFVIVCDPKSLLFIFGMQLDYSDALIGGGFSFKNPNASQTCGCGKSFAAEM
ncbi:PREDICTED: iron-sulfur assembly protein IscA, chloroplastic [Lupinus angustifolius]|uniref:iron-sulfur assembly protein IscA, chloroplastic n=1 Tax=Lupinus angustifolius TaxID=3871 RepID=UPI00092E32B1|nr:PREDICTED: iron-sulfur assembly protein IscA, chloroplastic [Lupinus angustifolius]